MRKLMWFTLGFGAVCGLAGYCNLRGWLLPLAAGFAFLAVACWYLTDWKKILRVGAVILLGAMIGSLWCFVFQNWRLGGLTDLHGQVVEAELEITDYTWDTEYGSAGEAVMEYEGKRFKTRIYLDEHQSLLPGDVVTGSFRIRAAAESNEDRYYQGAGIFLLAIQDGETTLKPAEALPLRYYPRYLYLRLTSLVDELFPADVTSFVKALLVGEDHDLDYQTSTNLNTSGIRHIIAVSGLHVTILFSLLSFLTGKRRLLLALLGIPVLLLFAAVVGFTPSVTRACVMQILIILGMLINREFDQLTALAAAALVMLVENPFVILSVSFQLSVVCMVGIFTLSPRIKVWLLDEKRLGRWKGKNLKSRLSHAVASSVSVTLGATVLTAPLSALHFGAVSLVSVITNLLTLWMVTALFCFVLIICGVGALLPGVGGFLAGIAAWGVRYVLWVADWMSDFPLAAVYTRSTAIVLWLAGSYLLLAVFLLLKNQKPGFYLSAVTLGLGAALLVSWLAPGMDECRLTVLDVGQGQCILYQSDGKSFLVDCGGDYWDEATDGAAETLLSQGLTHLDGLIVTHYDEDHVAGVAALMSRIRVDHIFLPDTEDPDGYRQALEALSGDRCVSVAQDLELTYSNTKITVYAPAQGKTSNENSMSVLFQTENCDILVTGDNDLAGERRLLERATLPDLELLVVGHHGSKNATSMELLTACMPDTAIISVGAHNWYGHPSPEVLERLEVIGCQVYRTDLDGTVIYKG